MLNSLKSPTNNTQQTSSNANLLNSNYKINLDDPFNSTFSSFNQRERVDKDNKSNLNSSTNSIIDEEFSNNMISFLDSEINDLTEVEFILKKLKTIDELKVAFSDNSSLISQILNSKSNQNSAKSGSEYLKKKYQLLNSVTIDLINNTSTSLQDRSKSKKK